jgi:hypothetical protein
VVQKRVRKKNARVSPVRLGFFFVFVLPSWIRKNKYIKKHNNKHKKKTQVQNVVKKRVKKKNARVSPVRLGCFFLFFCRVGYVKKKIYKKNTITNTTKNTSAKCGSKTCPKKQLREFPLLG